VPVEYAVKMIRLDDRSLLSSLLLNVSVDDTSINAIARKISEFHKGAGRSDEITMKGGTNAVVFNTEEDFQQVGPYVGETISRETLDRISDYTRTYLDVNRDLFLKRETDGWIRDGHGDLHTRNIYITDGIQVLDCIEFNERFRYGDILCDAAFLAMDMEKLGSESLAANFTDIYLSLMDQSDFRGLLNFYKCYRAVVRGKVEGFRSRDPDIRPGEQDDARENARNYFQLAEQYARSLAPPILVAACGLMGSGKSTVAAALGDLLDLEVLSSDKIRKELGGIDPAVRRHVPFNTDIYSREFSRRTYDHLHERASACLRSGKSVFIDASYMNSETRSMAIMTAQRENARFLLLHIDPGEAEIRKRLRIRELEPGIVSDGREEILAAQMQTFQAPGEIPAGMKMTLGHPDVMERQVRKIYRRLLAAT
jgi:aminoglycoside phosphotransferase family enzyme/predicted kinase